MKDAQAGERAIAVIGLGNVLQGDDAFGPYVVRVLQATYAFPPEVDVLDLGTPGLDLTPHVCDLDALIVVDTVRSSGRPGEVRTYRRAEILRQPPRPRLSPHDPGLKEALLMAEFAGRGPKEVLLVGAIPEAIGTGVGLSRSVRAAVDIAAREIAGELQRLDVDVRPRPRPETPHLWWEAEATPVAARA